MTENRAAGSRPPVKVEAPVDDAAEAAARLLPAIYGELRALAASYMSRRRPGETLQPTALVHEAYLRLAEGHSIDVRSRTHFFAMAAQAMRWVLADHARQRGADKRGGDWRRVTLNEAITPGGSDRELDTTTLLDLLDTLSKRDARAARIVELRFLAGLSIAETAEALSLSEGTIKNEWRLVRAWLIEQLAPGGATGEESAAEGGGEEPAT